jgi:Trp operon repressor
MSAIINIYKLKEKLLKEETSEREIYRELNDCFSDALNY